jgi:hypothetical protein
MYVHDGTHPHVHLATVGTDIRGRAGVRPLCAGGNGCISSNGTTVHASKNRKAGICAEEEEEEKALSLPIV